MGDGDRLVTERLVLRRWTDEDRLTFAAMNADPAVMEFFPALLSRAESDAMVDRIEAGFAETGFGLWALERRDSARFIGFTGLAPVRHAIACQGQIEVGWRLAREAWGHGLATEAARAALAYGFDVAGLGEVMSMTAAVNTRSRAVMERLGMRRDPADDFEHPVVPPGPLRHHVVYRLPATAPTRR
ncbi:MAG: GNAT family N-acetyltransferase [Nocardioidaceae bacterium]